MGTVIDIEVRRRAVARRPPTTGDGLAEWQSAHAAYVDGIVLPSIALWRTWAATWACLWLSPLGLEIRPLDPRRPPAASGRINRTR